MANLNLHPYTFFVEPLPMSRLQDAEANYELCLTRYQATPTEERCAELARKQIYLDTMRRAHLLPLRWYTSSELKEMDESEEDWPSEPRMPLELTETFTELPKRVKCRDFSTVTLDTLLAKLQALREVYGGQFPVARHSLQCQDYDDLDGIRDVVEKEDCLLIE